MEDRLIPVPLLDLKAQYQGLKRELDEAVLRVIASQQLVNGPDVTAFEDELAEYCGVSHAIAVSSGTDALLMALMALEVKPGDEVITTPFTFFATAGAIARLGATPVFVDIDPVTYNIDPAGIAARITARTRAILPVHLYGQCADMDPILAIAQRHGLPVIEDAAQAIDAEDRGRKAGSMGLAGCLSFYPTKNLACFGDGGALLTRDDDFARKLRMLRNHGSHTRYYHPLVGGNFRLDSIHAAVLRVKLKRLDAWTWQRQANAAFYDGAFARCGLPPAVLKWPRAEQTRHVYNQYVVRVAERDALREHLAEQQISTEVYYPLPLHLQECFAHLGYRKGDFPVSEQAAASVLALPVQPELHRQQRQRVANAIAEYYLGTGRLSRAA
ncbi:MAG: DegT/DnrJ/EryC1/StrS family aminotransferase [Gemmataceae bacterium]